MYLKIFLHFKVQITKLFLNRQIEKLLYVCIYVVYLYVQHSLYHRHNKYVMPVVYKIFYDHRHIQYILLRHTFNLGTLSKCKLAKYYQGDQMWLIF